MNYIGLLITGIVIAVILFIVSNDPTVLKIVAIVNILGLFGVVAYIRSLEDSGKI